FCRMTQKPDAVFTSYPARTASRSVMASASAAMGKSIAMAITTRFMVLCPLVKTWLGHRGRDRMSRSPREGSRHFVGRQSGLLGFGRRGRLMIESGEGAVQRKQSLKVDRRPLTQRGAIELQPLVGGVPAEREQVLQEGHVVVQLARRGELLHL